ncbi:MAG: hypothetical protein Q9162_006514 [Coniocarpon cinnabarinum]
MWLWDQAYRLFGGSTLPSFQDATKISVIGFRETCMAPYEQSVMTLTRKYFNISSPVRTEMPWLVTFIQYLRTQELELCGVEVGCSRPTQPMEKRFYRQYNDGLIVALDCAGHDERTEAKWEIAEAIAEPELDGKPLLLLLFNPGPQRPKYFVEEQPLTVEHVERFAQQEIDLQWSLQRNQKDLYERRKAADGTAKMRIASGRQWQTQMVDGRVGQGLREGFEWLAGAVRDSKRGNLVEMAEKSERTVTLRGMSK